MYVEIEPLLVEQNAWNSIKKSIDVFCKGENPMEIMFAVIGSLELVGRRIKVESIIIIPLARPSGSSAAFNPELIEKINSIEGLIAVGHIHPCGAIKPSDQDVATSVLIDRKVGRPIYHIIMAPDLEYEVYTNGSHIFELFKPVDEVVQNE